VITNSAFERFVKLIVQCYNDEDEQNQEDLIRSLAREHMLWARQASELMASFKNLEQLAKIAPFLMNRVVDRHNRFAMVSQVGKGQRTLLSKIS
jgi:23S rRNA C2498 (ribose-2'-O)-methylase RlmM